jgi:hypothetical protein
VPLGDADYIYLPGSGLEVPGIEAKFEYGSGGLIINDQSKPDQVRVTEISGLHDDPDVADSRAEKAGRWGERTGLLVPRGRTVGLTGQVRAGNVPRMRDLWRRTRAQFARSEKDFVVHPPGEVARYLNEVYDGDPTAWKTPPSSGNFTATAVTATTAASLQAFEVSFANAAALPLPAFSMVIYPVKRVAWTGEDIWFQAIVSLTPTTGVSSLTLWIRYYDDAGNMVLARSAGSAGQQLSPVSGTYYTLGFRFNTLTHANMTGNATSFEPLIAVDQPSAIGSWNLDVLRTSVVKLATTQATPLGAVTGDLPGFEYEGVRTKSRSYGPCYVANQFMDPDITKTNAWGNDSTSGVTITTDGLITRTWPGDGTRTTEFQITNPNTTARTLAIRQPSQVNDPNLFVVAGGRTYRFHLRLQVRQLFATANVTIEWLTVNSSIVSTTVATLASAPPSSAVEYKIDTTVVAPVGAVRGYVRIASTTTSTTTNDKLWVRITEPRFFDVSEYDLGAEMELDSTMYPEHGVPKYLVTRTGASDVTLSPAGAIRRIPRPFLLKRARAMWDGKAPESQKNLMARRDFTMSIRAADPRIYMYDERRVHLKLSGTPSLSRYLYSNFKNTMAQAAINNGYDDFAGTTAGSALGTRTAPWGGSWATSGATTDFAFADIPPYEGLSRTTSGDASPRFAVLGSAIGAQEVVVDFQTNSVTAMLSGVVARWVDANNYIRLTISPTASTYATLSKVVAGTTTALANLVLPNGSNQALNQWMTFRLCVHASGWTVAEVLMAGTVVATAEIKITDGALASGKPGIMDMGTSGLGGVQRLFKTFMYGAPVADPAAPPSAFVSENSSLDATVRFSGKSRGTSYPLEGVGLQPSEFNPPASGYLAAASVARGYYNGPTTTTPDAIVSGNSIAYGNANPNPLGGTDMDLLYDAIVSGTSWHHNYIAAVIKRVSSTSWIELRYTSAHHETMAAYDASPDPPYSLELWCSHNTAGTNTTTRLMAWDVPIGYLFDGLRKYVRGYMDAAGNVYCELWGQQAPNLNDEGLIARFTYVMSGSLIAVLGSSVAGRSGAAVSLGRWDDGTLTGVDVDTLARNFGFPYLSSFESSDYLTSLQIVSIPVIGDADNIPFKVELRGNIVNPTLFIATEAGAQSYLSLTGVFSDADPVTVDMDAGTIQSASGVNYFSRRNIGSRFFALNPGHNSLAVQAESWDSAAVAHVVASWRDALK